MQDSLRAIDLCVSACLTAWFSAVGRSITNPGAFQHSLLITHEAQFHHYHEYFIPFSIA